MNAHPTYPHTPRLPRYRGRDDAGKFTPKGQGFNAFGHPVSEATRAEAERHALSMGVTWVMAHAAVGEAADYVAADDPERAMLVLRAAVDLTGAYRLLAVLCTPQIEAVR